MNARPSVNVRSSLLLAFGRETDPDSKLRPVIKGHFSIRHRTVPKSVLSVDSRLSGKATDFQKHASKIRLHREILRIHKCLRGVYVQTRGEVAERLKAAVC
jgi:hypothetical protein